MPSRNTDKVYVSDNFYHIYNRGVNKERIFNDEQDYRIFLNLLKRYLDEVQTSDEKGRVYKNLHDGLELVAYCLMPNHFHMLMYLHDTSAITSLMQGMTTAYSMYYNKKYGRVGHLFQGRFKAVMIDNDAYLQHISRYIHLNPVSYKTWPYTSLPYYLGSQSAGWIKPDRIMELFDTTEEYAQFVDDYEDYQDTKDEVELELAY